MSLKRNAMNCFEISSLTLAIKTVLLLIFSCPRNTHVLYANLRREFNDLLVSDNCSNQLWPILARFFQNYKFLILEICMKGGTLFFSGYHDSIERQSQSYQKSPDFRHR